MPFCFSVFVVCSVPVDYLVFSFLFFIAVFIFVCVGEKKGRVGALGPNLTRRQLWKPFLNPTKTKKQKKEEKKDGTFSPFLRIRLRTYNRAHVKGRPHQTSEEHDRERKGVERRDTHHQEYIENVRERESSHAKLLPPCRF